MFVLMCCNCLEILVVSAVWRLVEKLEYLSSSAYVDQATAKQVISCRTDGTRTAAKRTKRSKSLVQSMQNCCFPLLNIQICELVAVEPFLNHNTYDLESKCLAKKWIRILWIATKRGCFHIEHLTLSSFLSFFFPWKILF